MTTLTKDPLLAFAKGLTYVIIGVLIFAMVMVGIGAGALATAGRAELMAKVAETPSPALAYALIIVALLLVEGALYLGVRFMNEMGGIIGSVDEGDPFRPDNADRLSRMGWIVIIGHAVAITIGAIASYLQTVVKEDIDVDVGIGGGGILLVFVLFILARVFRKGTEMREELEGTV